ncbi:uncharacterized protein PHALS_12462 [Plasmopara halstedii]|uniref:Uncharacterized protein n=1 Tax=Plasmopara halstedii TaxID=4781 RepID=A0A0P1AMA7_PLAHL|nr:uncharacterized protein PHALS_12462 [Plasmopara halstedii]CEG42165.1 hypothetical protein PHALS_12462 [Plasmopara halstedii]|eukprot:XP_024578534.1 hypothetical protein PHALS_12462 [Plasmopara halstedii]
MPIPLTPLPPVTEEINANTDIADIGRGKSTLAQDRAVVTMFLIFCSESDGFKAITDLSDLSDQDDKTLKIIFGTFATHKLLKFKKSGSPLLQTAMNYLSCLKGESASKHDYKIRGICPERRYYVTKHSGRYH